MKKSQLGMIALVGLMLTGCGAKKETVSLDELRSKEFEQIRELAKGSEVYFYGWGGSQQINDWLDQVVAPSMKKEEDLILKRVPMNIDEILNKLIGEKQAGTKKGTMDMIWINGENFFTAKQSQLMLGSFTDILPNYKNYVDGESNDVLYDFGYEVEGMEAPYGKAQFIMVMDQAKSGEYPMSTTQLLAWVKKNPGKFTYPAPPDFTGSAFVRNIAYELLGEEALQKVGEMTEEESKTVFKPVMDYLLELKPYLWNEGKSYPATIAQQENLFEDGEVWNMMSYNPNHVASKIANGEYPETVESFVFEGGTLGNTHFLTIPFNSPNKPGALVGINHIMSPAMQASKYDAKNWGDLPIVDYNLLSQDQKNLFDQVPLGMGVVPQKDLLAKRVAEPSAKVALAIEKLWLEVVGK